MWAEISQLSLFPTLTPSLFHLSDRWTAVDKDREDRYSSRVHKKQDECSVTRITLTSSRFRLQLQGSGTHSGCAFPTPVWFTAAALHRFTCSSTTVYVLHARGLEELQVPGFKWAVNGGRVIPTWHLFARVMDVLRERILPIGWISLPCRCSLG